MGVADIEGIQSEQVMADAKHFTAYTQETDRLHLDQMIPMRGRLQELSFPAPFRAAVTEAHVASVMLRLRDDQRPLCLRGPVDVRDPEEGLGLQGLRPL